MMRLDTRPRIFAAQALTGVLAGLIWLLWAPPRGQAWVIGHHHSWGMTVATLIPVEQEHWIATDGRFAALMFVLGAASAVFAWQITPLRGPRTVTALASGGVVSSVLAGAVGFLLGGGHLTGETGHLITTRLMVHATGFYFVQSTVCLFIYGLCVAFARDDDLGIEEDAANAPLVGAEG
jgi:hypothetical protein